jgi:glycosyltransferase involved in cell wall biosynthesis
MRIAVDISQLNNDFAGINQFTKQLLDELLLHTEHQFVLCARDQATLNKFSGSNISHLLIPNMPKWLGGGFTWYWQLSRQLKQTNVDWLLCTNLSSAPMFFKRTAMVIHDVSPFKHPGYSTPSIVRRYKMFAGMVARKAKILFAVSQSTATDFTKYFPAAAGKISVIGEGLHSWLLAAPNPTEIASIQQKYQLPAQFVLTVSTLQPRKNYLGMLEVVAEARKTNPNLHYIIVGKQGWEYQKILDKVAELKLTEYVHLLGPISNADLNCVYRLASAFMLLSFDEGFGLPIAESYAVGLPVIASDIPVFKEIIEDEHIAFVDPTNTTEAVSALHAALNQSKFAASAEFINKYSWKAVAIKVLQTLI